MVKVQAINYAASKHTEKRQRRLLNQNIFIVSGLRMSTKNPVDGSAQLTNSYKT